MEPPPSGSTPDLEKSSIPQPPTMRLKPNYHHLRAPIIRVVILLGLVISAFHLLPARDSARSAPPKRNATPPSAPVLPPVAPAALPDPAGASDPPASQTEPNPAPRAPPAGTPARPAKFCDEAGDGKDSTCIFDVGLNTGQDTKFYLHSSPGSKVVAIEAVPTLVDEAREMFAPQIGDGRLKLLNIGLVGNATGPRTERPKLAFWVNTYNNKFSSFKQRTGCRTPYGEFLPEGNTTFCRKSEMDTMSCSELIQDYGTPVYMKVDIEDLDRACLQALGNIPERDRPKYVSKENVVDIDVNFLADLGYVKFKAVDQGFLQIGASDDLKGYSGPWGEDAEDIWLGKKWHSRQQLLGRLPISKSLVVDGVERKTWFDLHASK